MNKNTYKRTIGFAIVSIMLVCAFTASAADAAQKTTLKGLMKASGMTIKPFFLQNGSGFFFGFTLAGGNTPEITLAPGLNRMLLVQIDGSEMIFQKDASGRYQIIQADGDIGIAVCVLNAVSEFLKELQTCTTPTCLFTGIMTMVTTITTCSAASEPVE